MVLHQKLVLAIESLSSRKLSGSINLGQTNSMPRQPRCDIVDQQSCQNRDKQRQSKYFWHFL